MTERLPRVTAKDVLKVLERLGYTSLFLGKNGTLRQLNSDYWA